MTFSFIVPVYNVEKYLAKCLDSLLSQTCDDYEIVIVNDGSPDGSQSIIDAYCVEYPDKIRGYIKENGGISDARNFGIAHAEGEYIVFVDPDDYVSLEMLEKMKTVIDEDKPDVLGFNYSAVSETGEVIHTVSKPEIRGVSGESAIISIVNHKQVLDTICSYTYRRDYWNQMGFSFIKGICHEDFALIPNVVFRAERVSCIDYTPYFYLIRQGSITHAQTRERLKKLAADMLTGYDFLYSQLTLYPPKNNLAGKMYMAYAANSLISKLQSLDGETKEWFREELIKRKVSKHIAANTLKRKIRKIYVRIKNRI